MVPPLNVAHRMLVSVIIPTYRRAEFLKETIASVWAQTRLPDEILIGDDSPDDITTRMMEDELIPKSPIPIRYFHHATALKEARNVESLYKEAAGKYILHLHDDDPILPRCVELLTDALEKHPEALASFGLQYVCDEDGTIREEESRETNEVYFRTKDRAGLVDGFEAGAVSMLPNNGFMIRTRIGRQVGYVSKLPAGHAVDYAFGLRVGMLHSPMYFVYEYTATVRMTAGSMSRTASSTNACDRLSMMLPHLAPIDITPIVKQSLNYHLYFAIANAATINRLWDGWRWFFSRYYRPSRFTIRGLKSFVTLLIATLKRPFVKA